MSMVVDHGGIIVPHRGVIVPDHGGIIVPHRGVIVPDHGGIIVPHRGNILWVNSFKAKWKIKIEPCLFDSLCIFFSLALQKNVLFLRVL